MGFLRIACALMLLVAIGCAQQPSYTADSDSPPLGTASQLVEEKIGGKDKFEEVSIQGGTGVLVDDHCAFWVQDGTVFALNGLAKSVAPDLEYGPPGLGVNELRQALRPAPAPQDPVSPETHQNPLGIDVHDILRQKGYLSHGGDVDLSINIWRHRSSSATITGRFEGRGNGMFNRRTVSLEMARDGEVLWKADHIRVEQGVLYVKTGSEWEAADIEG
mgnify:CR=1 FL=1